MKVPGDAGPEDLYADADHHVAQARHPSHGRSQSSPPSPRRAPFRERLLQETGLHGWVGAGTTVLAAIYLYRFAFVGWIPHDEGTIGHLAERVLLGEVPHRDFLEPYSGGLTLLHALGFRLLGVKLTTPRWIVLGFACAWVPAIYAIAARVARPLVAALVTALCVVWSVPNYFVSLPSWYNLFFATFGTWCLLRYVDANRTRWLVLAGMCGGLSLLFKIAGFYYVAAGLLFLVYCEQLRAPPALAGRPFGFACFKTAALALFALVLLQLVARQAAAMEFLHFVAPGWLLAAFLAWSEWREGRGPSATRFRRLLGLLTPFLLGVALPVVMCLLPFVRWGGLHAVYEDIFVLPQLRFEFAAMPLPGLVTVLAVLPYAAILAWGVFRRMPGEGVATAISATVLLALLYAGREPELYRVVWYSVRPLVPVLTLVGCLSLVLAARRGDHSADTRLALLLLVAMAAMVSLVQFPYAFGIYFCYAAPLVALGLLYVTQFEPQAPRRLHMCWMVFYLLFAAVWLNTGFIRTIGTEYVSVAQDRALDLPRGGLWVLADYQHLYSALYDEVRAHTPAGSYIYAGPDCPEVYFLTETRNPTGVIYDFMDDGQDRADRIIEAIRVHGVRVAVVNTRPEFSPPPDQAFVDRLARQFTHYKVLGWFVVLWREDPGPAPAQ